MVVVEKCMTWGIKRYNLLFGGLNFKRSRDSNDNTTKMVENVIVIGLLKSILL